MSLNMWHDKVNVACVREIRISLCQKKKEKKKMIGGFHKGINSSERAVDQTRLCDDQLVVEVIILFHEGNSWCMAILLLVKCTYYGLY